MAMFSFPSADFDVDHRDVAAQKRLLRERMAGFGWLTPRMLAHLDDTPDFYLDQVAQVVMDRWSSGRVGLLGDAAFSSSPLSGQGTGLALVGRLGSERQGRSITRFDYSRGGGRLYVRLGDPSRFTRITAVVVNADAAANGFSARHLDWRYLTDGVPVEVRGRLVR